MNAEQYKEEGNKKLQQKDFQSAAQLYSQAIELDPKNPIYYTNRAVARMGLRNNKAALYDCDKALSLDPKYAKAHFRRGAVHLALGDVDAAEKDMLASHGLEPSVATSDKLTAIRHIKGMMDGAASATNEGNWETAASLYQSVLSIAPGSVRAKLGLGNADTRLKKFKEAASLAAEILKDDSSHVGALILRAKIAFYQGNLTSALPILESALRLDPDCSEAVQLRRKIRLMTAKKDEGNTLFKAKKYSEALDAYEDSLIQDPTNDGWNSVLHCNKAIVKSAMNNHSGAVKDLDLAIGANSEYSKAYLLRAKANTELKNFQEAVRDYHEAHSRDPQNREIKELLSRAQGRLRESEKKDYYAIMELDKSATPAQIKKQYLQLAKKYHPDRHATADEDTKAAMKKKFQDLTEANDVLSDEQKRARYDRGEFDMPGFDGMGGMGGMGGMDMNDLAEQLFRGGFMNMGGGGGGGMPAGFSFSMNGQPMGGNGFSGFSSGGGMPAGFGGFGGMGGFPGGGMRFSSKQGGSPFGF